MKKFTESTINGMISKINALMSNEAQFEAYKFFLEHNIEFAATDSKLRTIAYNYARTLPSVGVHIKMMEKTRETDYNAILDLVLQLPEMVIYSKAFVFRQLAWNFHFDLKWILAESDNQISEEEAIKTKGEVLRAFMFSKAELKDLQGLWEAFKLIEKHSPVLVASYIFESSKSNFDWFANKHYDTFSRTE